jgi:hypothetical protein
MGAKAGKFFGLQVQPHLSAVFTISLNEPVADSGNPTYLLVWMSIAWAMAVFSICMQRRELMSCNETTRNMASACGRSQCAYICALAIIYIADLL